MLTLSTCLLAASLAACGTSAGALQDATRDWRQGHRTLAATWARAEVEHFRSANALTATALDAALQAVDARFDAGLPLVADGDHAANAPTEQADGDVLRGLHADLLAPGATRVLRAIHAVRALALPAFGPELLQIVATHAPYMIDGPLLREADAPTRAVAVKAYALRALEGLSREGPARAKGPAAGLPASLAH